jgi:hypothetical protein
VMAQFVASSTLQFNLTDPCRTNLPFFVCNAAISAVRYRFYFSNFGLKGTLPQDIFRLPGLNHLVLDGNDLLGSLPDDVPFNNLLTRLSLIDVPHFDCTLPVNWTQSLPNLQALTLGCKISRPVFSFVYRFQALSIFALVGTGISDDATPFLRSPPPGLRQVGIFDEPYLVGNVTALVPPAGNFLQVLIIANTMFSGSLPNFAQHPNLVIAYFLQSRFITGSLPALPPTIQQVVFSSISVTGTVPTSYVSLTSLTSLFIEKTSIVGPLPRGLFHAASAMSSIFIFNNDNLQADLSDVIPTPVCRLKAMLMYSNKLEGAIPSSLGNCLLLSDINLSNNSLSGTLPTSFVSLPSLSYVLIARNRISGPLPTALLNNKPALIQLSLSDNAFAGGIVVPLTPHPLPLRTPSSLPLRSALQRTPLLFKSLTSAATNFPDRSHPSLFTSYHPFESFL